MSEDQVKLADWEYWAQLIDVMAWEAVALSFGAEPETIRGLSSDWRDDDPFENCQTDFRRKLKIVCNHIESGALRAEAGRKTAFRKVKLVDFSEWACAAPRRWSLPPQFPGNLGLVESHPAKAENAAKERPPPEALDKWMLENIVRYVKRDQTISACRTETGARVRDAAAAFMRLPADRKLARGKKPSRAN